MSELSGPAAGKMRRCSEWVGRFPEPPILRNPSIRFGFGRKANSRLRQGTGPGHLHGEAVIVSVNQAIIRIAHVGP